MAFTSVVFPSTLKIVNVAPFHKKDSKLDFSNYRPISFLSNLDKILKKLIYTRIFELFNQITNSALYNSVLDKNIQKHMLYLVSQKTLGNI